MTPSVETTTLNHIAPFFIVSELRAAVAFYRDMLGFDVPLQVPADEPFFGIVSRDGVQIMLKAIGPDTPPLPNSARHAFAKWDAFVHVSDPDALAAEFASRDVTFRWPLGDTEEGLRGFEVADVDEYVIFFGRPN